MSSRIFNMSNSIQSNIVFGLKNANPLVPEHDHLKIRLKRPSIHRNDDELVLRMKKSKNETFPKHDILRVRLKRASMNKINKNLILRLKSTNTFAKNYDHLRIKIKRTSK